MFILLPTILAQMNCILNENWISGSPNTSSQWSMLVMICITWSIHSILFRWKPVYIFSNLYNWQFLVKWLKKNWKINKNNSACKTQNNYSTVLYKYIWLQYKIIIKIDVHNEFAEFSFNIRNYLCLMFCSSAFLLASPPHSMAKTCRSFLRESS